MNKIIAVPVDNQGVLDNHFGHCKFFALFRVQEGKIISEEIINPLPHEPGVLPKWLAEKGVNEVIAGGMGHKAVQIFNQQGVKVNLGAPQITANSLVEKHVGGEVTYTGNLCDH